MVIAGWYLIVQYSIETHALVQHVATMSIVTDIILAWFIGA